jgi:hypothetical protein
MSYTRIRITAANGSNGSTHNPTLYVKNGGNDALDGTTLATALATPQAAIDRIKDQYDSSGFAPVIKFSDGTYPGWEDYGPMICRHRKGGGPPVFIGNLGNSAAVVIQGQQGVNVISYDGSANAVIVGLTINAPGASAIYATNGSIIEAGMVNISGMIALQADSFAKVVCTSTIKFIGPMTYGLMANKHGLVETVPGVQVYFDNSSFTHHFCFGVNYGAVVMPYVPGSPGSGVTFSGSFTGQKGFASLYGMVNSGFGTYNQYPGTGDCGFNVGGVLH